MGSDTYNFPQAPLPSGLTPPQEPYHPPSGEIQSAPQPTAPPPPTPQPYHPPPNAPAPPPGPATAIPMPEQPQSVRYDPPPNQEEPPNKVGKVAKILVAVVVGSLSLVAIGFTYGILLGSEDLARFPERALVAASILTFLAITLVVPVCAGRSFGALLPVVPSIVAGGLVILLFATFLEFRNSFQLPEINLVAVAVSCGVFGGISLGSMIAYFVFA